MDSKAESDNFGRARGRGGTDWLETEAGRREFTQASSHELLHCFAEGSYGKVWLARSVTGAWRAIKVVYRRRFKNDTPYEREFHGILKFEPVSRLHEGFVDILHVGRNEEAGYFYYIMELGDDQGSGPQFDPAQYNPKTLASELARQGRLPLDQCLQIGISLSDALGRLHRQGLVHRDIKPSNVIFVNGVPKLADIGLVTDVGADVSFVGTEGYIPREGPGKPAADIYSLGKVLYEISTGKDRKEFPELPVELLEPSPHRDRFLELNEIVLRACEDDDSRRYRAAEELHAHLALLQAGKSVKGLLRLERAVGFVRRYWAAAAVLFALANLVFFLGIRELRRQEENRQREAGSFVGLGTKTVQEGDLAAALPWFVVAQQLDRRDDTKDTHRLRIAAILQQTPQIIQMWFRPRKAPYCQFGPDDATVLITAPDGRSGIYRVDNGELVSPLLGNTNGTQRAVWNHAFNRVVTSESEDYCSVFDTTTGKLVCDLDAGWTKHACFSPQGDRILATGRENRAGIFDARTGVERVRLGGVHTKDIWHGSWHPDGTRVVTAGNDERAVIWDALSGAPLFSYTRHRSWVQHASFSPDGRLVATCGADRTIRLWDAETGQDVLSPITQDATINSVEFSPDGKLLVAAVWDGTVRVFDAATGKPAAPPMRHSTRISVWHACFSHDGRKVLTTDYGGVIRVWQLPMPFQKQRLVASPSGDRLALWSETGVEIRAAHDHRLVATLPVDPPLSEPPQFSPDGRVVLIARLQGDEAGLTIRLIQPRIAETGAALGPAFACDADMVKTALCDDGRRGAVYSNQMVRTWDLGTGQTLAEIPFAKGNVAKVAFDHAGNRLAVCVGRRLALFDPVSGHPLLPGPIEHRLSVADVQFDPSDSRFVTTCLDSNIDPGEAQIWDARTGERLGRPMQHVDGVLLAVFSPDGRDLATGGEDFTAMVWNAKTGLPHAYGVLEHNQQVRVVAFDSKGRWLATATKAAVCVWDVDTGVRLTPPMPPPGMPAALRFLDGDRLLVVQDTTGTSTVFNLLPELPPAEDLALTAQLLAARALPLSLSRQPHTNDLVRESWDRFRARRSPPAQAAQ